MCSPANLDRRQHSRYLLNWHEMTVQGSRPTRERWSSNDEIGNRIGGKGEYLLFSRLLDRMDAGVKTLESFQRWGIPLWPRSDEIGRASIGCVLVDQRLIDFSYEHETRIGQRPLRE